MKQGIKKIIPFFLLSLILVAGFYYRLKGIQQNYSFWADEAYVSSFARDIITGKSSFFQSIQKVWYQPFQILTTAVFFKLFGISEFSARLPSALFGGIGTLFAFLVARRLSNSLGGILAAFLFAFSQLLLANSIQAKPYAAITLFFLINIYLYLKLFDKKIDSIQRYQIHLCIICISIMATLFHLSGVLVWIPYLVIVVSRYAKCFKTIIQKPIVLSILILIIFFGFYQFGIKGPYNHTMYLKNLFLRQYGPFSLCFLFSFFFLWKKYKTLVIGLVIYSFVLLFLWNFQQYSPNIRYLVSFFGIVFVFFAVFWGKVGEYLKGLPWLIPLIIILLLIISRYKIAPKPLYYYSPNMDFYGDVQIADYKTMFEYIHKKFPDYMNLAIFNSSSDAQRWYLEKMPDAYFVKKSANYYIFTFENHIVYNDLYGFLKEQVKYPKGLFILEDWESFLPQDIKEYVKKNLKLELRIESLSQAKNDPWPLEVYSWGFD